MGPCSRALFGTAGVRLEALVSTVLCNGACKDLRFGAMVWSG